MAQAAARALGSMGTPDAVEALEDALAGAPAANGSRSPRVCSAAPKPCRPTAERDAAIGHLQAAGRCRTRCRKLVRDGGQRARPAFLGQEPGRRCRQICEIFEGTLA